MYKKLKQHLWLQWGALALVGLLAVGYGVFAYYGDAPNTVIEQAENITINNPQAINEKVNEPVNEPAAETLGAVSSPNINSRYLCVNGDCAFHITGSFNNSTTTIVGFVDPFIMATSSLNQVVVKRDTDAFGYTGATSTIEFVQLNFTATTTNGLVATSTYAVTCGPASTITSTSSAVMLYGVMATSSLGMMINDVASSTATAIGGIATREIPYSMLTPQLPYFTCKITSDYGASAGGNTNLILTNNAEVINGTYAVRISRPQER